MQINSTDFERVEQILIGNHHFDTERKIFINKFESCDLLAVPGSGKTTALLAKLYCLSKKKIESKSYEGILVLSHTNAAIEEFKKNLFNDCPELFEYPNFVGTVQDFVDTFLAIPFYNKKYGHGISRIDASVYKESLYNLINRSIRNRDNTWKYYVYRSSLEKILSFNFKKKDSNVVLWNYSTDKEFEISIKIPRTWNGHESENLNHIKSKLFEIKNYLMNKGILNYEDCYFLAQDYLDCYPRIQRILCKRFPYVFIDETQDLQIHQLEIIDRIFNNAEVCLQRIGDVNQSIFNSGMNIHNFVWHPRNEMTFNNSLRLTSSNADIVNAFMINRVEGQNVHGTRSLQNQIPPYLFVYDYEHRNNIKRKFIELINLYHLNDSVEGKKYGYHIIGWNKKWNDNAEHVPNKLRLSNLFIEFAQEEKSYKSLVDYITESFLFSDTGKITQMVYNILCICLQRCGIYEIKQYHGSEIKCNYTIFSLKKELKNSDKKFIYVFNLNVLQVVKSIYLHHTNDSLQKMNDLINKLLIFFNAKHTTNLNEFLSGSIHEIEHMQEHDEIKINYETVHGAKGQTHCATLYVETIYEGHYESDHLLNKKKTTTKYYSNPFYKETEIVNDKSHAQSTMKMLYVGLSRPTHLLCYAMHKSSFDKYNADRLHNECGWEIIDLTHEKV